ncbi:class I SAM-dependent methyltransferase [Parvularcula flava]|nr:class I SAM-dependent methyltransferase [Aquisalinus luteolus]NHK26384.1 class I SAM-dependent methyltransferase [Aquisalinus luteolus]
MLRQFSGQTRTTDQLLQVQTNLSFSHELKLLRRAGLGNGKNLLDLGCGNGAYLREIEKAMPGAQCFGLERDETLAQTAQSRLAKPNSVFTGTGIEDLPEDMRFDIVLARYVALHLPALSLLGDFLRLKGSPSACLLLIDAADSYFEINRPMPLLRATIAKLWAYSGVNRTLHDNLEQLEYQAGLKTAWQKDILIHSDMKGLKAQFAFYMLLNAKFAGNDEIEMPLFDEVLDWYQDDESSAQFGLFGALLRPN